MAAPRIGVLALQGDVREHRRALDDVGAQSCDVRHISDLAHIDALVIPGGESTTMSKLADRDGFFEPLREAQRSGMPMYGSCAGMIMLANDVRDARPDQQTVGGLPITVRRNAFGRQVDSFEMDLDIPALGAEPFPAVFIRAPWVEGVGEGVAVLATIEGGPRAGTIVAVEYENVLATSFHPEITGDTRVHAYFVERVRRNLT